MYFVFVSDWRHRYRLRMHHARLAVRGFTRRGYIPILGVDASLRVSDPSILLRARFPIMNSVAFEQDVTRAQRALARGAVTSR